MPINLLPEEYKRELFRERLRRLTIVSGVFVLSIIVINIILLTPLWFLFRSQEKEFARELKAVEQSPDFLKVADTESEIEKINSEIDQFNDQEEKLSEVATAIKSVLEKRPAGIRISNISYVEANKARGQVARLTVSGTAINRELLLDFAEANRNNVFFEKVHSPISNLLKENNFSYSLVLDLNHE